MSSSEHVSLKRFFSEFYRVSRLVLLNLILAIFIFGANAYSDDPFLRSQSDIKDSTEKSLELGFHNGSENTNTDSTKKEPTTAFPGYGAFRELFNIYCKRVIADGHYSRLQDVLDKLAKERADCRPCRQLYKGLVCKVSTKQSAVVPVPTSAPSTELLAVLSELFVSIAANPQLAGPTAEAISPVLAELSTPLNPLSDAYFEIFTAFIREPLSNELKGVGVKEEKQQKKIKKKQLEALF